MFEEAREFTRKLNLKNQKEWVQYTKSGKMPSDIPTAPARTYKNSGWISLGDWLGTGTVASTKKNYQPFEQARNFVRSVKLKTQDEWRTYCKSGHKPDDIPANPRGVYKDSGWISMRDWLGTEIVAS